MGYLSGSKPVAFQNLIKALERKISFSEAVTPTDNASRYTPVQMYDLMGIRHIEFATLGRDRNVVACHLRPTATDYAEAPTIWCSRCG